MKKKVICMLMILIICSTSFINVYAKTSSGKEKINYPSSITEHFEKIGAAYFENGNIYAIEELNDTITNLTVSFKKNRLKVSFKDMITKQNYNISVEISPIANVRNDSIEWIGTSIKENDAYEIVNFRIEETADLLTLMEPNIFMQGHVVLFVAIRNNETEDIIYFQKTLDDNYDYLKNLYSALENVEYNEEELFEIREKYYSFKSKNDKEVEEIEICKLDSITETDVDLSVAIDNISYYGENNIMACNLINSNIPDSIFKSGALNKWYHKNYRDSNGGRYAYSYISYQMSGTKNRETHIIIAKWTTSFINGTIQNQLKIIKNVCVLYVPVSGLFGISRICTSPLKFNSVTLENSVSNCNGYITYRNQYASIDSSKASKIVKCIIAWVPYLSKAADNIKTLSSSAANNQETYDKSDHINTISVTSKPMKKEGDYIFLQTNTAAATNCKYTYSYTVSD